MRRINEFKSYRSVAEYDVETGQFVVTPMPGAFPEDETADSDAPGAEIVPFPALDEEPLKRRLAG